MTTVVILFYCLLLFVLANYLWSKAKVQMVIDCLCEQSNNKQIKQY
jgi:hypothetical protein